MTTRFDEPNALTLKRAIDDIYHELLACDDWGKPADYIPELRDVDVQQFAIAVITSGGTSVVAGDADRPFTIQSVSKVFALYLALEYFGEAIWRRVGREPSGDPYNSIIDLEHQRGIPRNPYINAGALVVVDMLLDRRDGTAAENDLVRAFLSERLGGRSVEMDGGILKSEGASSFTNRALANLSKSFGNLHHSVDDVIDAYVRQCSVLLSCRQLAEAGRCLLTERTTVQDTEANLLRARHARRVASLMLTCGQYDGSGDFAYRVGLPAKSGVSGAILALVPNTASIAVWAPGLDGNGNSLLGTRALEALSDRMDWSVFGAVRQP